MINMKVDGAFGEGGGQILRTSTALAALLGEPVEIYNIRKNRSNPGLAPQHLAGIKALQDMVDGEVKGAEIGSTKVAFYPGRRGSGRFTIDTKTAGSITLILQTLLIPGIFSRDGVELDIRGGTDVKWSPPIDYVKRVFLPILKKMGVSADVEIIKRGYYPKGSGRVVVTMPPVERLKPLKAAEGGSLGGVKGLSHSLNLPAHIVERMANSARDALEYKCSIELECGSGLSTGCGIALWAEFQNSVLGASALGAPGKPAEKVGREAAKGLLEEIESGATLDTFMGDQVIPYMGLADGTSETTVKKLTGHIQTNICVVEKILGVKYDIVEKEGLYLIKTRGRGFVNETV
jgi:RNA 3'-terminal phosphate cyclase (ATP)